MRRCALLLLLALVGACDRGDDAAPGAAAPLASFDTVAARIETATDTFRLTVEVAETEEQRAIGLMERPVLPEDHGMLFLYPEPQDSGSGFWMYRTLIPLDIAFLDAEGRITQIRAMEPCQSPNPRTCRVYTADEPYTSALEVNRGYFAQRGVGVGDRVVLDEGGEG